MSAIQEGLMSFEDEKLHAALAALKETEKRCEVPTGFIKGHKKRKNKNVCPYVYLDDACFRMNIATAVIDIQNSNETLYTFFNNNILGSCLDISLRLF